MSSRRGSITLSELVGKLDLLEIKCHRCDRHGRVSLARSIEEYGADTGCRIHLLISLAGEWMPVDNRARLDFIGADNI